MMSDCPPPIDPANEAEWSGLEALIRDAYERCHPDDSFDDMKRRSVFSKEDKGALRDWMRLAAERARQRHAARQAGLLPRLAA